MPVHPICADLSTFSASSPTRWCPERRGHTEAAIDLSTLSLIPAGVICEIQNQDGSMARLPQLRDYADQWNLRLIGIVT